MLKDLHCSFSCVLQIDSIFSAQDDFRFACRALLQVSVFSVMLYMSFELKTNNYIMLTVQLSSSSDVKINNLLCSELISVDITFTDDLKEHLVENAIIFCIGSLLVDELDSDDPSLTVCAQCLIIFVSALIC
jgi:hypothetical protein